jgi:hypothetical protein
MEIELYGKAQLDNLFRTRPDIREELYEHRITEPFDADTTDHRFQVIPGDRRDLLALPACDITGATDQAFYVNLGLDYDDGAAYLGSDTFHHLASLLNYCHADELRQANKRNVELEKENARLRELIDRVRFVRRDIDAVDKGVGELIATGGRKAPRPDQGTN